MHLTANETILTTVHEVRFQDLRIEVRDSSGRLVAASAAPNDMVAHRVVHRPLVLDGETYRVLGAYPLADETAVLDRIRALFLVALPLLLASAAMGGQFLARRGLRPVGDMAARATAITASTLHERLPVTGGEELTGLARVINDLLDRLEAAFAQQRRFMADASHELRTPTAIVRTEADVTLARPHREEGEYRAALGVVQDASRRLTRIVDDLFLLARADAGQLPLRAAPLYLDEVVHDATRAVTHLAASRGVRVELRELAQASVTGDADLLGRLFLNLLDNAIKHSTAGGVVDVAMTTAAGNSCAVAVVDHGSGIPPEAQPRIFERFFSMDVDTADPRASKGAGLGLPIARRIAEMHGGTLALVASRAGRTEFRVLLPVRTS